MIMKLFPKIEYQSIFSAFGSSTASWLYNLCEAFRGNLYTDNSIWVLEILKKKKKRFYPIGFFAAGSE